MQDNRNPQNALFDIVDQVPSQVWYSLGILSILASLVFQLIGKKNWADFIGKWPPTFLLVGLYHKLLRPGSEDTTGQLRDLAERAR